MVLVHKVNLFHKDKNTYTREVVINATALHQDKITTVLDRDKITTDLRNIDCKSIFLNLQREKKRGKNPKSYIVLLNRTKRENSIVEHMKGKRRKLYERTKRSRNERKQYKGKRNNS